MALTSLFGCGTFFAKPLPPKHSYSAPLCRADLENHMIAELEKEAKNPISPIYYHDNGKTYRSIDIRVEIHERSEHGNYVRLQSRGVPNAYWGYNPFTGEQISGMPERARALLDGVQFHTALVLPCPASSEAWLRIVAENFVQKIRITEVEAIYRKILLLHTHQLQTSYMTEFLQAFNAKLHEGLDTLEMPRYLKGHIGFKSVVDISEYFSTPAYDVLRIEVGIYFIVHDLTIEATREAQERAVRMAQENRYMVIIGENISVSLSEFRTKDQIKEDIKKKAASMAHHTERLCREVLKSARKL